MAENWHIDYPVDRILDLIKQIHNFNIITRCYNSKKWRKNGPESKANSSTGMKKQNSISAQPVPSVAPFSELP